MGFDHIPNLYSDTTILMFKEVFALEKIHGTSSYVAYDPEQDRMHFHAGGVKHHQFVSLFDAETLLIKFREKLKDNKVIIYGEAYGGKLQKMSKTYGDNLKFVAFDVRINHMWLSATNAHDLVNNLGIDYVDYVKIPTDKDALDAERDKESIQAVRNGCGHNKLREGIVIRPLMELTMNNGRRIIAKHKRKEFSETKTPRELNAAEIKVISDAKEIAEEWVTEMRLEHVLAKFPEDVGTSSMPDIIKAMIEDVEREGAVEIVTSKESRKFIGNKTAFLFKERLKKSAVEL